MAEMNIGVDLVVSEDVAKMCVLCLNNFLRSHSGEYGVLIKEVVPKDRMGYQELELGEVTKLVEGSVPEEHKCIDCSWQKACYAGKFPDKEACDHWEAIAHVCGTCKNYREDVDDYPYCEKHTGWRIKPGDQQECWERKVR